MVRSDRSSCSWAFGLSSVFYVATIYAGWTTPAWFWMTCFRPSPSRSRRRLDAEERELALYLLISPHGNALGCFRLPIAYLCDDLGKDAATAARTLARLCELDFLARDEATGWTWITGYLQHNPIPTAMSARRSRSSSIRCRQTYRSTST